MITVITLLIIIAFVAAVLHVMGKCPLWVAVFMLCLIANRLRRKSLTFSSRRSTPRR